MSMKQIDNTSFSATLTNPHILPVEILKAAKFTDVTVICGESKLSAHRVVLAARSGYFQEYFKRNPQATEIKLDADFDDLKCIILYLYQGVIVICADRRASFLQLAKQLSITIDEKNMFAVRTRMEDFAGNEYNESNFQQEIANDNNTKYSNEPRIVHVSFDEEEIVPPLEEPENTEPSETEDPQNVPSESQSESPSDSNDVHQDPDEFLKLLGFCDP